MWEDYLYMKINISTGKKYSDGSNSNFCHKRKWTEAFSDIQMNMYLHGI